MELNKVYADSIAQTSLPSWKTWCAGGWRFLECRCGFVYTISDRGGVEQALVMYKFLHHGIKPAPHTQWAVSNTHQCGLSRYFKGKR